MELVFHFSGWFVLGGVQMWEEEQEACDRVHCTKCIYLYMNVYLSVGGLRDQRHQSPGAVLMDSCELPHIGAGNSGPLQEQYVFLLLKHLSSPKIASCKQTNKKVSILEKGNI